jgi:hypothetical protein
LITIIKDIEIWKNRPAKVHNRKKTVTVEVQELEELKKTLGKAYQRT